MSEASPLPSGGHIIIIGGGATGALCAVELAKAGYKVTVVEKRKIGNGSSSRSAACIRAQFGTPATVLGMVYSERWYGSIHEHLHTPEADREDVLVANGYLFLYENSDAVERWRKDVIKARQDRWKSAQANAAMQQKLGLPVEVLDMDEVRARWPHLDGEQVDYLVGATWCPTDGFLKHDLIYTLGFRRARELGVTVLENAHVVGSRIGPGRQIQGVFLSDGTYLGCDAVVNATNAWAPRVSASLGGSSLPIKPVKRYLTFSEQPEGFSRDAWDRLPMTIYGMGAGRVAYSRPDAGGLMIGWAHPTEPDLEFRTEDQDRIEEGFGPKDTQWGQPYAHAMVDQVRDFAPALVGTTNRITGMTCGYYGDTPDHNPMIGWDPQVKGLMHACGFSGHGLMHAPITAALVEGLLSNRIVQVEGQPFIRLHTPWSEEGWANMPVNTFAPGRTFNHVETDVL